MLHFKTLLTAMTVMAAWAPSALAADCEVVCVRQDSACKHLSDDASRIELQVAPAPGMSDNTKRFTGDKDGVHFEVVAYLDGSFITLDAIPGLNGEKGPFLFNVNYGKGYGSKSYKLKAGQETCQADIPKGTNYVTVAALTAAEKN